MAVHNKLFNIPMVMMLGLLIVAALHVADAKTGVCYGMRGNNLPPASNVIALYKKQNIQSMRLYEPDQSALRALKGSNIELILGVPNDQLKNVASSHDNANKWVKTNVLNYPDVRIKYIAVGNEVSPLKNSQYVSFVLPAMTNIQNAISRAGKGVHINVSTAIEFGITNKTYPPLSGEFKPEVLQYIDPIIQFLVRNGSPLLVNIYPYFAYAAANSKIKLEDALFTRKSPNEHGYSNLFDAMVDAAYFALKKVNGSSLQIVVSESGWPTAGGKGANTDNAKTYNQNLIDHVREGSPKRGGPIETYIFAMFDENQKGGDEVEKHWGIFSPNGSPKYQLKF